VTDLLALIPELQQPAQALVDLAGRAGVLPRVTSTLRTRTEQERLYRRFQQGLNPYPVAPPGTSAHEYGYAFDLVVSGEQNQLDLGTVWQQWGGVWGGTSDPVHFEYPGFKIGEHVDLETSGSSSGVAETFRSGYTTVMDTILGIVPFVGKAELAATVAQAFGLSDSAALEVLASPAGAFRKKFPGAFEWMFRHTDLGILAGWLSK